MNQCPVCINCTLIQLVTCTVIVLVCEASLVMSLQTYEPDSDQEVKKHQQQNRKAHWWCRKSSYCTLNTPKQDFSFFNFIDVLLIPLSLRLWSSAGKRWSVHSAILLTVLKCSISKANSWINIISSPHQMWTFAEFHSQALLKYQEQFLDCWIRF